VTKSAEIVYVILLWLGDVSSLKKHLTATSLSCSTRQGHPPAAAPMTGD